MSHVFTAFFTTHAVRVWQNTASKLDPLILGATSCSQIKYPVRVEALQQHNAGLTVLADRPFT